ncbi:MAG: serine hydrolase domain-containing protein [Pyrinomonadaceae bacterium]
MLKKICRAVVGVIVLLSVFSGALAQTFKEKRLEKIRADLGEKVAKGEAASLAVGVIRNGKTIWKEGFGWADKERKIRATPETVYPLASISKSLTATGLWVLAEDGKIDIDAPVEKYLRSARLTYYHNQPEELKVRHLLYMEAGIPHQLEYFYDDETDQIPPLPERINRYGFTAFPAGKVHNYSNFSFSIVEQIAADVSGRGFSDLMRQEVFRPLGMKNTFPERPAKNVFARGYGADGELVPANRFEPRGGAGMYSSVDDLLRYGLCHLGRKGLLKKRTIDLMHSTDPASPNPYYANGWGVLPMRGGRISLLSNGAIAGAAGTVLVIPTDDLVIVCLTNTTLGNDYTDQIAFQIAGALLDGYGQDLDQLMKKVGPFFESRPFSGDDSLTGNWAGEIKTHQGKFPIALRFTSEGKILAKIADQTETEVTDPSLESGLINGYFDGRIPTEEALRRPHRVLFSLMRRENRLFGVISAQALGGRPKFLLPYYVELVKK